MAHLTSVRYTRARASKSQLNSSKAYPVPPRLVRRAESERERTPVAQAKTTLVHLAPHRHAAAAVTKHREPPRAAAVRAAVRRVTRPGMVPLTSQHYAYGLNESLETLLWARLVCPVTTPSWRGVRLSGGVAGEGQQYYQPVRRLRQWASPERVSSTTSRSVG